MLLKQDQAANAAVELVRKGICNDWFTVRLKVLPQSLAGLSCNKLLNCFATGWHVPLSVALTQNMAVPTNGSSATVQAEASRELSILVAITSTCCTQQVSKSCQASINTTSAQVNFSGVVAIQAGHAYHCPSFSAWSSLRFWAGSLYTTKFCLVM